MSLSANQDKTSMLNKKIQWQTEGSPSAVKVKEISSSASNSELVVTINPMEVKTFFVQIGNS